MNRKAFDIETIQQEEMIDFLPEPEVKFGNTKDSIKRNNMVDVAKKKQIEKMAINPFFGRVCSASFYGDKVNEFSVIESITDADEIDLLKFIFDRLVTSKDDLEAMQIITWNGYSFDFPFIYKRAAVLRLEMPLRCPGLNYWRKRYSHNLHCDLQMELNDWKIEKDTNLDYISKILSGKGKTKRDYSTYLDLIKNGEGEKIGLDNLCDTQLTFENYLILEPYLF